MSANGNIKGRGNLGFGWIEKKDLQSNKLTRTRYNQSYPYIAQVAATKEYIETDESRQLLNQQINTYRNKSLYDNKVHSIYLYQSQEESYDFNSSDLLTTVTTNQSNIDDYGNVGTISVTTKGNDKTFTKTTQNTYNNDPAKWHLGRIVIIGVLGGFGKGVIIALGGYWDGADIGVGRNGFRG